LASEPNTSASMTHKTTKECIPACAVNCFMTLRTEVTFHGRRYMLYFLH